MSRAMKIKGSKKEKNGEIPTVDVKFELRKLKRVIYLSDTAPTFTAGDPELFFFKKYPVELTFIGNIMNNVENPDQFLEILRDANNDPKLPRRVTLFYVLAYALRNHAPNNKFTNQLADMVLVVCKTDEEFFKFVSIFSMMKGRGRDLKEEEKYNKVTTSMSRIIRKFLEKKTPTEYAKAVASAKGYHGWKYKDLIKLSHYKSESAEKLLVTDYVLRRFPNMEEPETEDMKAIYMIIKDWYTLKHSEENVEEVCKLIEKLGATYRNVNSKFVSSQEVWGAIIPNLPMEELLILLPKFNKYNMFNSDKTSIVLEKVKEVLTVNNVLGRVSPLRLFIHLKNFQKGGKPLDPKLENYLKTNKLPIKTPPLVEEPHPISTLISQCLQYSYPVDPTILGMNRKVMVVMDVEKYESICFKHRNVNCLEAQIALASYFSKTEKNAEITVFNGSNLEYFDLEPDFNCFNDNLKRMQEMEPSKINLFELFDWSVKRNKNIDVFIVLLQSIKSLTPSVKDFKKNFKDAFRTYVSKTLNAEVKIVIVCLGAHNMPPFQESVNTLTICGFSADIPNVINSFINKDLHYLISKRSEKED